jgi:hypothetical protein
MEMVPHAVPLQPAPLKLQVTAAFKLPVTVAVNCWVAFTATAVIEGDTAIPAAPTGATLRVAGLLVVLPAVLAMTTVSCA